MPSQGITPEIPRLFQDSTRHMCKPHHPHFSHLRYPDHPRIGHWWVHAQCIPLSKYPKIPRYSDHARTEYPEIPRYSDHPEIAHALDGQWTPMSEYPEIPSYCGHLGTVHGWAHAQCILLSEYPKILRYSDHPRMVHGWQCTLLSEYPEISRYSYPPRTVQSWQCTLLSECPEIPRYCDHPMTEYSWDTVTIPGQYIDGHMHTVSLCQRLRVFWDLEILWPFKNSSGMSMHSALTSLSKYPEIPRYSDHPRRIGGWAHTNCTPLSEYLKILWPSKDITRMSNSTK